MAGNYLSAGLNVLGMVGNLTAMSRACFTGDMEVITRRGWVRWDALREDDEILSRNEYDPTGELAYRPIDLLMQTEACIWHVRVAGKDIRTTSEHPFYVVGKGWIAARELQIGDILCTDDGRHLSVEGVQNTGIVETVYNCSVADYHTYFVGRSSWGWAVWAHNTCKLTTAQHARRLRRNMGNQIKKGEEAHHIVASTHKAAKEARKILRKFNIDIDSAKNGVGLVHKLHRGKGLHSKAGIEKVTEMLRKAKDRDGALAILERIRKLQKAGNFLP